MIAEIIRTIRIFLSKLFYKPRLPFLIFLVDINNVRIKPLIDICKEFGWAVIPCTNLKEPVKVIDVEKISQK